MSAICVGCGKVIHQYDLYEQNGMQYHLGCPAYTEEILYTFSGPCDTEQVQAILKGLGPARMEVREGKIVVLRS